MTDYHNISFEFEMFYDGRMVTVRVDPGESGYGIHFDYRLVAELEQDDDGEWIAGSGELDDDIVYNIGQRIDKVYGL